MPGHLLDGEFGAPQNGARTDLDVGDRCDIHR